MRNVALALLCALTLACDDESNVVDHHTDSSGNTEGNRDGEPIGDAAPDARVTPPPDAERGDGGEPDGGGETRRDGELPDGAAPDGATPDGEVVQPDAGSDGAVAPPDAELPDVPPGACVEGLECDTGRFGPCAAGAVQCPDGPDGDPVCERLVAPQQEVCDGGDNDCDGATDEGFGEIGEVCVAGRGQCAAPGVVTCDGCLAEAGLPAQEACDLVDNDCDGATDEGFEDRGRPCSQGVGLCEGRSVWRCSDDGAQLVCEAEAGEPTAELCDGLDNDCDGSSDEGFPAVGEPCEVGVGVCLARGTTECRPDGNGVRCSATLGEPGVETCDLVDNDCDGEVDEGNGGRPLTRRCYTGPDGTADRGTCRGGTQTCTDGLFGRCEGQVLPFPEACDGADRDCDGSVDESFAADCYAGPIGTDGVGACRRGRRTCEAGVLSGCIGEVVPLEREVCDDVDNDCDGRTDEGLAQSCQCDPGSQQSCYTGPAGTEGVGACVGGTQTCEAGARYGACVDEVRPAAEICNGVDDDCDGATDEDVGVGQRCVVGVGACAAEGVLACAGDAGANCEGAVAGSPHEETCNLQDDDCDGTIDEGFVIGEACSSGVGACEREGVTVCGPLGALVCSAAAAPAVPEVCDGLDNDCDGALDEGFPVGAVCTSGAGGCAVDGRVVCGPDGRAECSAEARPPAPEACNGEDDDCDGAADEGLRVGEACQVGAGACQRPGVRACEDGAVVCAAEAAEGEEACNGADDDCDGTIDEGNPGGGEQCDTGAQGLCAEGRSLCLRGQVLCVVLHDAQPEGCNGLDDDCDGRADEDFGGGEECRVGVGACERVGRNACDENGEIACTAIEGMGGAEICNGADDDCDGTTDEEPPGVGVACEGGEGLCAAQGATACVDGALACDAELGQPAVETCDGRDEDCDGAVDEDFEPGAICQVGVGACARDGAWACAGDGTRFCDGEPGQPTDEICNGADDDCDGETDEPPCVDDVPPEVRVVLSPPVANVGQTVTVTVEAEDLFGVVARAVEIDGEARVLDANHQTTFRSGQPGAFEVHGTATDAAGNIGEATAFVRFRDPLDVDQPFVRVTFPEDQSTITARTTVRGTATDASFFRYTVEISPDGVSFLQIAEGFVEREDQPVAELDPTLLAPGLVHVKLTGEDLSGNDLFHQVSYQVPDGLSVGEYRITLRDLEVGLTGLPIYVDRTYDSRRRVPGDFGIGWTLDRGKVLTEDVNGNVAVKLPDGHTEVFGIGYDFNPIFPFGTVHWTPPAGSNATLENMDDCLAAVSGGVVLCAFSGRSVAQTVENYRLTLGDGTVYEISDRLGIRRMVAPAGETLTFDADGVSSSNGLSVEIDRDLEGRVLFVRGPQGEETSYQYDERGRLVQVVDPLGGIQRYEYDRAHLLVAIIGADGNPVMRTEFDEDGRKVRQVDALGNAIHYEHDLDGRREVVTDRRGNVTTYRYDANGRVVSRTDAEGSERTFTWDGDRLVAESDGEGNETRYGYDAAGNQVRVTDAAGRAWDRSYDERMRVTGIVDPDGAAIHLEWDADGHLLRVENAEGGVQTFEYDASGRRTAQVRDGVRWEFAYDGSGNLTEIRGPGGFSRGYEFDAVGRITALLEVDGAEAQVEWDALGRLVGFTDHGGGRYRFERDGLGRLTALTEPGGETTRYAYDARGLLASVTDAAGGVTRYDYDEGENLVAVTDAKGAVRRYEYDALDRISAVVDPVGGRTETTFDGDGRIRSRVDARGRETLYAYDASGRRTSTRYADGSEVVRSYDGVANLASVQDPTGVTELEFDADSRLVRVAAPAGAVSYTYGAEAARATRTDPGGEVVYEHDDLGRLTRVGPVSLERDARGRVARVDYPGGGSVEYEHDAVGRVVATTARDGNGAVVWGETRTLDAAGRVTRVARADGRAVDLSWDAVGRLVGSVRTDGGQEVGRAAYAYDAVGNRTDGGRTYDAADRLEAQGIWTWEWDENGNLARKLGDGRVEVFSRDDAGRLVQWSDGDATVRYAYDGEGRRISREVDGVVTRYVWDFGELAAELDGDGAVVARYFHGGGLDQALGMERGGVFYGYVRDGRGDVVGLLGPGGALVASYEYDDFGAPLAEAGDVENPLRFQARPHDPLTGLSYFRARWYDPAEGRFIEPDPVKGNRRLPASMHPYVYAHGDPYTTHDPTGAVAAISYGFISSQFVVGNASADVPSYGSVIGSFIGFMHGFTTTPLVFLANIFELANTGQDIAANWGTAISRTKQKMDEIADALGRLGAVDSGGFVGGYVGGAGLEVGFKIELNIPDPINRGLTLAGQSPPDVGWSYSKKVGGFNSGVESFLDYAAQLAPR